MRALLANGVMNQDERAVGKAGGRRHGYYCRGVHAASRRQPTAYSLRLGIQDLPHEDDCAGEPLPDHEQERSVDEKATGPTALNAYAY